VLTSASAVTASGKSAIRYRSYLKHLSVIVFSSTMILGLIIGAFVLVIGETSINLDGVVEFSSIDGLWVMLGLPIFSVLIFVIVSPLSFFVYRLLLRGKTEDSPPEA